MISFPRPFPRPFPRQVALARQAALVGASVLAVFAAVPSARAQIYESRAPFGTINLAPPQSAFVQFESLVHGGNFVSLAKYPDNHPGKRLSRAVGRLDLEYRSGKTNMCTATLVSPDYILTNHHCIPGTSDITERFGPVTRAQFVLDYYDAAATDRVATYPVVVTPAETSARLDYSLLRVEGGPARRVGTLALPIAEPVAGEPFIMFHHPLGQPKTLSARGCKTADKPIDRDGQLLHYCDTQPGSSGALILDVEGKHLIGLHFAGTSQFNLAQPLSRIRRQSPLLAQLFPDQSPPPVRPAETAPPVSPPPLVTEPPRTTTPTAGSSWTDPTSGIVFVWVPGGSFEMGCGAWSSECFDDEKPLHRVSVPGFWLGKTEVTQNQWQRVMNSNPSSFQQGGSHPVEQVSWNDAQAFIAKLNGRGQGRFRLPSEAEWEYACRSGGKQEMYCGGNSVDTVAWYSGNSGSATHPVGSKSANGLGLQDMSGNVWEWVEDCRSGSYSGAPSNGSAWISGNCSSRVLRGGSWGLPLVVRSAIRGRNDVGSRFNGIGFRVARTVF